MAEDVVGFEDEGTETTSEVGETTETQKETKETRSTEDIFSDVEGDDEGGEGAGEVDPERIDKSEEDEVEKEKEEVEKVELSEEDKKLRIGRVNFAQFKKEYPDALKKYPGLRDVIYRENQYGNLFGSPEGAKEMAEKGEIFDYMDESLANGNSETLLTALNEGVQKKFAAGIIKTFHKINPELVDVAVRPVFLSVMRGMIKKGMQLGKDSQAGKNLIATARILHHHLYDDYEVPLNDREEPADVKAEKEALKRDREALFSQREAEFKTDLGNHVHTRMVKMIEEGLDADIKPGLKEAIIDKILEKIDEEIAKDSTHMNTMKSLWNKASRSGYARNLIAQIANTHLGRAKTLMGGIRSKYLAEIKGNTKPVTSKQVPISGGGSNGSGGKIDPKKIDPRASTLDIFEGRGLRK